MKLRSHYKFILASIAFHFALLLLLLWQGKPQQLEQEKSDVKPIQAYFVKTVKPEPRKPEPQKPAEVESKQPPDPESVTETVDINPAPVKEQMVSQIAPPAQLISPQVEDIQSVDLPAPQTVDAIKQDLGLPKASMLQNSLSILRQQSNQQATQRAVGEFGKKRSLSVMDGEPVAIEHSDLPEPGPQIKPVEVDCNNTGAKAMSMLSGLLGGNINCAKGGDFQHYIDKRLERIQKRPEQSGRLTSDN